MILVILATSLLSMYVGIGLAMGQGNHFNENLYPNADGFRFGDALSLVLPCFIGIYSGVNNARHLKDPFRVCPNRKLVTKSHPIPSQFHWEVVSRSGAPP